MYKLVVSELAHMDLDNIISYIAKELSSPVAALKFLDEVEKRYDYLKNNPYMHERCQDARLEKETYRKTTIKNYVIVYKVDESSETIVIYRFFYGAQDYVNLI